MGLLCTPAVVAGDRGMTMEILETLHLDKEIESIRQRWLMTTSGEWVTGAPDQESVYASRVLTLIGDYIDPDCRVVEVISDEQASPSDLVFIAHAHQDVPFLLHEITRLSQLVDALSAMRRPT